MDDERIAALVAASAALAAAKQASTAGRDRQRALEAECEALRAQNKAFQAEEGIAVGAARQSVQAMSSVLIANAAALQTQIQDMQVLTSCSAGLQLWFLA